MRDAFDVGASAAKNVIGARDWQPGLSGARYAPARVFLALTVLLLALVWRGRAWPMVYDDLHLIRAYSRTEKLAAFHGHWDPDQVETPALRPLTLLFNDARYRLLGENVVAHRLLLIGLYAGLLMGVVRMAVEYGVSQATAIVAALLCVTSRYSVYHYLWITDGNHILQGWAVLGAIYWLTRGLDTHRTFPFLVSLALALLGLLVREDTASALGVVMLLGWVRGRANGRSRVLLAAYVFGLCSLTAGFFLARQTLIPEAIPPRWNVRDFVQAVARSVLYAGDEIPDVWLAFLSASAVVMAASIGCALYVKRSTVNWRTPALCMAAVTIACVHAFTVGRADVLFFPVLCGAFAYATACDALAHIGRSASRVVISCAAWAVFSGAYTSTVFSTNWHLYSTTVLRWQTQFAYGAPSEAVTIPPERLRAVRRQLREVGIQPGVGISERLRGLEMEALRQRRREPGRDAEVFVPRLQNVW